MKQFDMKIFDNNRVCSLSCLEWFECLNNTFVIFSKLFNNFAIVFMIKGKVKVKDLCLFVYLSDYIVVRFNVCVISWHFLNVHVFL